MTGTCISTTAGTICAILADISPIGAKHAAARSPSGSLAGPHVEQILTYAYPLACGVTRPSQTEGACKGSTPLTPVCMYAVIRSSLFTKRAKEKIQPEPGSNRRGPDSASRLLLWVFF